MAKGDGLFTAIKAIFGGRAVGDNPPTDWMLHRYIASDIDYAPFAKDISLKIFETAFVWEIWRAAVPRGNPRFQYTAAKKSRKKNVLANQMVERLGLHPATAEEYAEIITLLSKEQDMFAHLGTPLKDR